MAMAFEDRRRFAEDVLKGIEAPLTPQNMELVLTWMAKENTGATFNPLATTMGKSKLDKGLGYTVYNWTAEGDPLVLNYPNWETGVQETIDTLIGGQSWKDQDAAARQADYYDHLVDALRDGTSLQAALSDAQIVKELGTWGSLASYTTGTALDGTSYALSIEEIQQKLSGGLPALASEKNTGFTLEQLAGIYSEWGDANPLVPEEFPVEEVPVVEVPDTSGIASSFEESVLPGSEGLPEDDAALDDAALVEDNAFAEDVFAEGAAGEPVENPEPVFPEEEVPTESDLDRIAEIQDVLDNLVTWKESTQIEDDPDTEENEFKIVWTDLDRFLSRATELELIEAVLAGEITTDQIIEAWNINAEVAVNELLIQNEYRANDYNYVSLWGAFDETVDAFLDEWVAKRFDYQDSDRYTTEFIAALESQEWWTQKTLDWKRGLEWTYSNRFGAGVEGSEYETQLSDAKDVVRKAVNDFDSSLLAELESKNPFWVEDFVADQIYNGLGSSLLSGAGDWGQFLVQETNRALGMMLEGDGRPAGTGNAQINYDAIMAHAYSQLVELNPDEVRQQANAIAAGTLTFDTVKAGIDNQAFSRVDMPVSGLRDELVTSSPYGTEQTLLGYLQPLANAVGSTWGLGAGELNAHDSFVRDNMVFTNDAGEQRFRTSLEMSNLARQDGRFKESPIYKSGMGNIVRSIMSTMGAV